MNKCYRVGVDIGSTTVKVVVLEVGVSECVNTGIGSVLDSVRHCNDIVFSGYRRHHAGVAETVAGLLREVIDAIGDVWVSMSVTGSVGMGFAERFGLPFVQEVIAATEYVKQVENGVSTIIDIGGEDAKVVLLQEDGNADLRMNGNCAGGTGAFIDQMALLLNIETEEMDAYASRSEHIHPIASRCGVFSKTDVQNLISKNVKKEDIVASVFRAVAVQTITTLSHGCRMRPKIMLCGGPLTFIPSLRRAFMEYMELPESDFIVPENAHLIPAWGAALSIGGSKSMRLNDIVKDRGRGLAEYEYSNELSYKSVVENRSVAKDKGRRIYKSVGAKASDMANALVVNMPGFVSLPNIVDGLLSKQGNEFKVKSHLPPIFSSTEAYEDWKEDMRSSAIPVVSLDEAKGDLFLGIDSGSTTTKIVLIDEEGRVVFFHYAPNQGNSIEAVKAGLEKLADQAMQNGGNEGRKIYIKGSCSTGYGEDLIKAAFSLDYGIIETVGHYLAAKSVDPSVSFILDIGGQDMKAIFVENGLLNRMEINEACSSGCGSFIETFAHSLGISLEEFSSQAAVASSPSDLGTRCTVFMNSKVKQVMREGSGVGDIAAGLCYSVVRNCLYKVLKLKRKEELGNNIVVQGGTMRNDAVVGALERLSGAKVSRSNIPELMGAYGCALYARSMSLAASKDDIISTVEGGKVVEERSVSLSGLLEQADYTTKKINCNGCENKCYINRYVFAGGRTYYSGNKCEKVYTNQGAGHHKGENISSKKNLLLFDRQSDFSEKITLSTISENSVGTTSKRPVIKLGIPRCLGFYENYPFWHSLFTACGLEVVLSDPSTFAAYEEGVHSVMSDNICFPAKLVHSHIYNLIDNEVDRIFFPYVHFEKKEGKKSRNSFNCPIVSGYPEVLKSAINPDIPIDSPVVTFREKGRLERGCLGYLKTLGIDDKVARRAFNQAYKVQEDFEQTLVVMNREAYANAKDDGKLSVVLAGRPYHTDPLIQHKISDMISDMGVTVLTEDITRGDESVTIDNAHLVTQWSYINRILRAAQWVAEQGPELQFVQITSFGCGPDAFLLDEVRSILGRYGKSLTLLKVDDVNNIGSLKLRVRSLIESLHFGSGLKGDPKPLVITKEYTKSERHRVLIAPFFTDYISPLIPAVFKGAGYEVVQLGESDTDSVEYGLKYANNEVCYPATLVVGDLIKALDSGKYDLSQVAVIITQTGGQCRASNYLALLKRAMIEAGYEDVPVLSLAFGGLTNAQSGFKVNWLKILPMAIAGVLFGDTLSKFYHASAVRERVKGDSLRLREKYLSLANDIIIENDPEKLYNLIPVAAKEFKNSINFENNIPKAGIVGEIYLKFNSFAHKRVVDWLIDNKIEAIPPVLMDFFMESFVNRRTKHITGVKRSPIPLPVNDFAYSVVWNKIKKVNELASEFPYFTPFHNIFDHAENGREIITLSAQYGEGWLLPAEIVTFAKSGVNNVISLQPFGCIANHIISKGMEKKIKTLYPNMNLLSLDFDGGVSDVNIMNRLILFANNLR